jgi:hypothetical protein
LKRNVVSPAACPSCSGPAMSSGAREASTRPTERRLVRAHAHSASCSSVLTRSSLRAQGERLSSSEDHGGSEDDWERISQSGISQTGSHRGSSSQVNSQCASQCGDDVAVDALADDWALIGTIGEDGPAAGWDRLPEYEIASCSGRTTPSSAADKSLAELLCAGPFASRAAMMRRRKKTPRAGWRPLTSAAAASAPAPGAPAAP